METKVTRIQIQRFTVAFIGITSVIMFFANTPVYSAEKSRQGLVGAWFGKADLTNIKDAMRIKTLEQVWHEGSGYGQEWSAKWEGFLVAPASGEVTLHAETDKSLTIEIDGKQTLQVKDRNLEQSRSLSMVEGIEYPVTVIYSHEGGFNGYFRVKWSWAGQEKTTIPPENLRHTVDQERRWNWVPTDISDMPPIDRSSFVTVPARHVFVYNELGSFAGWPANNGIWSWEDEILVGFHTGHYKPSIHGHSIDGDKPQRKLLARSLDGGETWTIEEAEAFDNDDEDDAQLLPAPIDFDHPDFALHCDGGIFHISYDRGKTWEGAYRFPLDLVKYWVSHDLETWEGPYIKEDLTSRTDYIVRSKDDCLFFLSAKEERVEANLQDRAFCARTTDGGKTVEFLSWMTDDISVRSVMPSTVRISENQLVSAMRRKKEVRLSEAPDIRKNWIDVYTSEDNGQSWKFLSKVADTDKGKHNGNPPAMVRLRDGRLCVTYGYRSFPYGIRARISNDEGKTWEPDIHLRDDGRSWDFGYTRTVQRSDGKLVTIYYYTTQENPEQHIVATIWDADLVAEKGRKND